MVASQSQQLPALTLPPAYTLVTLSEADDAFAHACRIAPEAGAGTFLWVQRFDVLEFAVVLEPEESLAPARRAVLAGMAAMADAVCAYAPPEKPVTFTWPATIHFDGGRLGGGRLGWPPGCAEDQVPDWLVFGGMLLARPDGQDPGAFPDTTWLEEEGFFPEEGPMIVESFARHLMVAFHAWSESGFKAVADPYLARLPKSSDGRRGIDGNGDLLIHGTAGVERVSLLDGLREPAWLDPATGLPRL